MVVPVNENDVDCGMMQAFSCLYASKPRPNDDNA
jgi:hypothetical protein